MTLAAKEAAGRMGLDTRPVVKLDVALVGDTATEQVVLGEVDKDDAHPCFLFDFERR
jgi:hypothetical protein